VSDDRARGFGCRSCISPSGEAPGALSEYAPPYPRLRTYVTNADPVILPRPQARRDTALFMFDASSRDSALRELCTLFAQMVPDH
jgi:hypothetical protein